MIREPNKVSSASIQTLKSDPVVFELTCFREILSSAERNVYISFRPSLGSSNRGRFLREEGDKITSLEDCLLLFAKEEEQRDVILGTKAEVFESRPRRTDSVGNRSESFLEQTLREKKEKRPGSNLSKRK